MLDRLAALDTDDPATKSLVEQARAAINKGAYDLADRLLGQAEQADARLRRRPKRLQSRPGKPPTGGARTRLHARGER